MIISQHFFLTFNNPAEATTRIGFGTLDETRQNLQNRSALDYDDEDEAERENSGISLKLFQAFC